MVPTFAEKIAIDLGSVKMSGDRANKLVVKQRKHVATPAKSSAMPLHHAAKISLARTSCSSRANANI